jgi:hypothetical protein
MSTTWEQLESAVLALARSGTIKDRLADAFRNHLTHLSADALPDALRADFQTCHDALTRERPLRGEDAVRATVRKMSNEEADEVACRVVRLFGAMTHELQHEVVPAAHAIPAMPEIPAMPAMPAMPAVVVAPEVVSTVNGAHNGMVNGAIPLNGALKGKRKGPKSVPQIISLYAAEA